MATENMEERELDEFDGALADGTAAQAEDDRLARRMLAYKHGQVVTGDEAR